MASPSRTLSIGVDRSPADVYAFASDPENLPTWSFFEAVFRDDDGWRARTAHGEVRIRFAPRNAFGVIDHWVRVSPTLEVYAPMRVLPNGVGAEVIFTLFRLPATSDEEFERDAATVQRDLERLRDVLEGRA